MKIDPNPRMSYQYPMPKETLPDLVVPHAIPTDERVWVPQGENVWFRPLCLNRSQGYWMNLLRVRKSGVLSRHRHPQAVHGVVLKGRWRYLEHDWVAEEGSYVFEPPGETHTLVVPDDVEEMITAPASITSRAPTITAILSKERTCASPTRRHKVTAPQ
jgi:2,4'-dihydroxyacetophenone dioxygenase